MKSLEKSCLIFAGVLMLAACAKENKDNLEQKPAGDAGACSSQFSVEFNDILANIKAAKASEAAASAEKLGKYQELNRVCEHFFSKSQPTTCQGFDKSESRTRALSVFEIKPSCDEAKKYLQDHAPAQPTPTPGPAPAPGPNPNPNPNPNPRPQPEVKKFEQYQAKQIKVVIADLAAVKKAFNDQKLVIAGGKVKSLKEAGAVHCVFSSADREEWNRRFSKGLSMRAAEKHENPQPSTWIRRWLHVRLEVDKDEAINFGCGKTSADPFTISEVREAVRGILELRIANE